MTIRKLLEGVKVKSVDGPLDTSIKGIAYDSRLVKEDFLFVAVRGFSVDGHDYIKDALSRGATAVFTENAAVVENAEQFNAKYKTSHVAVPDSREALALISAAFYGHPSKRLLLVGITGTNGKTTTSYITKSIIDAGGINAGLIGTIQYIMGDRSAAAANTTPESLDLQRYLREMVNNNMGYAVLEVSSHALVLKRIEGCSLKAAAFTNFSQDHLDFHGSMDEYFRAKSRIFTYLAEDGSAVLNCDDPAIKPLEKKLNCNVITCGTGKGVMIKAENITEQKKRNRGLKTSGPAGLSFQIKTPSGGFAVNSGLIGRFNVHNILTSIGIAYSLGFSEDVIQKGIRDARPVEGRFENIDEGQDFLCVVDYAHTEDALKKLIGEARHITKGRVITVFGCGGDRDRTKRPLMGEAASELSDLVVVTSDNPRTEEPAEIINDIVSGLKKNNHIVMPDRAEAIREAVSLAKEGDTVLIAGKGHEDYQEINGIRHHFSDKEVVREAIKAKRY